MLRVTNASRYSPLHVLEPAVFYFLFQENGLYRSDACCSREKYHYARMQEIRYFKILFVTWNAGNYSCVPMFVGSPKWFRFVFEAEAFGVFFERSFHSFCQFLTVYVLFFEQRREISPCYRWVEWQKDCNPTIQTAGLPMARLSHITCCV